MSLYDEIIAGGFDLANRDDGLIAATLSAGRKKLVATEIGNGLVLATLGLTVGNALLDVLNNVPDFRYVKPLLEQGRLDISTPLARDALDGLVGVVEGFTQEHANTIKSLAEVDDRITPQDVARALEGV